MSGKVRLREISLEEAKVLLSLGARLGRGNVWAFCTVAPGGVWMTTAEFDKERLLLDSSLVHRLFVEDPDGEEFKWTS